MMVNRCFKRSKATRTTEVQRGQQLCNFDSLRSEGLGEACLLNPGEGRSGHSS